MRRLRWPVVSIGNLSTGGAGKNAADHCAGPGADSARVWSVDVLSRGYGRSGQTRRPR